MADKTFGGKLQKNFLKTIIKPIILGSIVFVIFLPIVQFVIAKNKLKNETETVISLIDDRFYNTNKVVEIFSNNVTTSNALIEPNSKNLIDFYESSYSIVNNLNFDIVFYLVNDEGIIIASNNSDIRNYELEKQYFANTLFIYEIENSNGILFKNLKSNKSFKYNNMTFAKKVVNEEYLGAIFVELPNKSFDFLDNLENDFIITDRINYLIEKSERIIVSENERITSKLLNELAREKKLLVNIYEDNNYPFNVMSFMKIQPFIILIYTEVLFISIFITFIFLVRKSILNNEKDNEIKVVNNIFNALQKFKKGETDYRVEFLGVEDLDEIASNYNSILNEIDELIVKNINATELKKIAEIKQLQSQFNPHFLFNVLETIKYTIDVDTNQAKNMMNDLASLLRYSINFESDSLAELGKDLEYMEYYFKLQKERYENRLDIVLDIEEGVENLLVPKLLFQPLIENSINHGFEVKEFLKIYLSVFTFENSLFINVIDNGGGIDTVTLGELENLMMNEDKISSKVGIINTYRRLKAHFGEDANMIISSKKGYTSVTIYIRQ